MVPAMSASASSAPSARRSGRPPGRAHERPRGAPAQQARAIPEHWPGTGAAAGRRFAGWRLELAGHAHSGLSERNTAMVMAWPLLILIASTRGPGA